MPTWTTEEISDFVNKHKWYHKIKLAEGIVTPGMNFDAIWDNIRKCRDSVDYAGKTVLDIGSWDGMWAFEAERLGASKVVATDMWSEEFFARFLTIREILGSKVRPYFNVSPYNLYKGLEAYLVGDDWRASRSQSISGRLFDVVQHLGVLYHLRDPMWSLGQARSVLKQGGILILETAVLYNTEAPIMLYNCNSREKKVGYPDVTTWWIQSPSCVKEMLRDTMFEPIENTCHISRQGPELGRMVIAARAVGSDAVAADLMAELNMSFRNPGLEFDSPSLESGS